MKNLDRPFFKYLSFPDFIVSRMEFNPNEKYFLIEIDGAWLDTDEMNGKELGKGIITFCNWSDFEIKKFDIPSNQWTHVLLENFEPLNEICEYLFNDERVFIRGFGVKSGAWIEYKIDFPISEFKFETKDPIPKKFDLE